MSEAANDSARAALIAEKRAPVQGYSAGIPWAMHLRAYDAYCKENGKQQALIEDGCRGGFSVRELDAFIPGWREELSELHQLRATIARVRSSVDALMAGAEQAHCDEHHAYGNHLEAAANYVLAALDGTEGGKDG